MTVKPHLELLCLLSSKDPASLRLLCDDLACNEKAIRENVALLRTLGLKIKIYQTPHGEFVIIDPVSWRKSLGLALTYQQEQDFEVENFEREKT